MTRVFFRLRFESVLRDRFFLSSLPLPSDDLPSFDLAEVALLNLLILPALEPALLVPSTFDPPTPPPDEEQPLPELGGLDGTPMSDPGEPAGL